MSEHRSPISCRREFHHNVKSRNSSHKINDANLCVMSTRTCKCTRNVTYELHACGRLAEVLHNCHIPWAQQTRPSHWIRKPSSSASVRRSMRPQRIVCFVRVPIHGFINKAALYVCAVDERKLCRLAFCHSHLNALNKVLYTFPSQITRSPFCTPKCACSFHCTLTFSSQPLEISGCPR